VGILLVIGYTIDPFSAHDRVHARHEEFIVHPIELVAAGEDRAIRTDRQAEGGIVRKTANHAAAEIVPVVNDPLIVSRGAQNITSGGHAIASTVHYDQAIASVRYTAAGGYHSITRETASGAYRYVHTFRPDLKTGLIAIHIGLQFQC